MSLWGGRFQDGSSAMFRRVNDSLPFDRALASQDIRGSIAWSKAIFKAGVLTQDEQQQLEQALQALLVKAEAGTLDFDASTEEDIHSFVEATLIEQLGDIARKLHTGRSRNDQVATDFKLWTREHVDLLIADLENVKASLVSTASNNRKVILPGYTHLQRAQPVRYPHWCLAYVEMFKRDISRLHDLRVRLNQSPLGCGALAGTTYPIDRYEIATELGFDSPCLNSLDAVSDRDFVLELLFVASTSMMHMSRMAEDLIFFNSGEAGFITLGDAVTSGSSLMPQKKGLPLAYNKDMQEDKEGLLDAVTQWHICLCIACEVLDSIKLDSERCAKAAREGYANATELADYLVAKGIPFRTAHDISGQVVLAALEKKKAIEELSVSELQKFSDLIEDDVYAILQLEYLVDKRSILGGTGIDPVTKALDAELAQNK
jgi:argininosuccinate lyase